MQGTRRDPFASRPPRPEVPRTPSGCPHAGESLSDPVGSRPRTQPCGESTSHAGAHRSVAAPTQAHCLGDEAAATQSKSGPSSTGWPSRQLLLQGHLFDSGLINQALEIIEKRGGDFEITAFSVQPNDQRGEFSFNFKRTSSVALTVMAVNTEGLDDITSRLQQLVNVIESAEGSLTVLQTKTA